MSCGSSGEPVLEELRGLLDGETAVDQAAARIARWNEAPWSGELLAGAAELLRRRALAVRANVRPLIDTCGTGGDGACTINLSTAAAFVVVGAGGAVAKHGNRAVSSPVGSADVLAAAGAAIELPPEAAAALLDATGFAFLLAPRFHPELRRVAPARRLLRTRTLFNALGPLCNPAGATRQLVGVWDPALTRPVAEALARLGCERALVVHCGGLDEFGLHAPTRGHALARGEVREFACEPGGLGLPPAPLEALRGGDAATNAALLRGALARGPEALREQGVAAPRAGAIRDAVALNAAAALHAAGLAPGLRDGLALARATVAGGDALRALERYVASSRRALPAEAAA